MSHNACIISFFMNNIDMKTCELQHKVVEKFNNSKYPHYAIQTDLRHGASMDFAWKLNGLDHPTFKQAQVEKKFDHDIIMFLDIDALPLNDEAIDYFIDAAANGKLIGNIQRSNHIQNNQHVFAAPSAVACSVDIMLTLGMPSALETYRADVGEEYTYAAEKAGIPVELLMPLRFDAPPAECASWALADGMPVYGRGTTFGYAAESLSSGYGQSNRDVPERAMIWHNFQSFHPGQQERFWAKCEELLKE